jgi:cation diffusion facilitator family transporter
MTKVSKSRQKCGQQVGVVVLVSNLALFVVKYIAGVLSNSVSIQADAVNNLTDTISAILTIVGFRIAAKPRDKKHPNGYGRMEYLVGLGIAAIIVGAGALLLKQSAERFLHPTAITIESLFVFIIPAAAVLVKIGLAIYSHKLNKSVQSPAINAIKKDCLLDALTTLLTLVTLGLSQITALPVDALIGVAISGLIVYNGVIIAKENIELLLGNSLDFEIQQKIETAVNNQPEFSGIKSIITNDFGPGNQIVVVELLPCHNFKTANIQKAADDLSLTFEKLFDFKIIAYWSSKRDIEISTDAVTAQSDTATINVSAVKKNTSFAN